MFPRVKYRHLQLELPRHDCRRVNDRKFYGHFGGKRSKHVGIVNESLGVSFNVEVDVIQEPYPSVVL